MPHCVAHGCNNKSNNNTNVSYFTLPDPEKDPHKYKAWFCAIGRESLPKHGRICSDHFTEDSYELTSILKAKHCELQSTKMKLKKFHPSLHINHYQRNEHAQSSGVKSKNRIRFVLSILANSFSEANLVSRAYSVIKLLSDLSAIRKNLV